MTLCLLLLTIFQLAITEGAGVLLFIPLSSSVHLLRNHSEYGQIWRNFVRWRMQLVKINTQYLKGNIRINKEEKFKPCWSFILKYWYTLASTLKLNYLYNNNNQWCYQDFFQDQDQDQDPFWCILEADWKTFFIFGRKRKRQRKWNSTYGRKRKRKSPDNVSVFFSFFIDSVTKSWSPTVRRRTASNLVQFRLFCRWSLLTGFHIYSVDLCMWYLCGIFLTF